MGAYNIVLSTNESTIVTEYEPQTKRSDAYQSEAALEAAFIKMLGEQGYEYVTIHNWNCSTTITLRIRNGIAFSKARLPMPMRASWKRSVKFKRTMFRI